MDQIDWKILRYIGEEMSISKLASRMFITQPAVSYRLTKMEGEFEAELFIRSNKGISLTDAGKRLKSYAPRMLFMDEEIKLAVSSNSSEVKGQISIGIVPSFFNSAFINQLKTFRELYQKISLEVYLESSLNLRKKVMDNIFPFVIVRGRNFDFWEGEKYEITSEMTVIIANEPITHEYLLNAPCISYINSRERYTDLHTISREWFLQQTGQLPTRSPIEIYGDSRDAVRAVKNGLGWAVVTDSKLQDSDGLYNQVIYDKMGSPFLYKTCLLYKKEIEAFDVYRVYLQHFKHYFSGMIDETINEPKY